jgi:hypothetical protein
MTLGNILFTPWCVFKGSSTGLWAAEGDPEGEAGFL